MIVTVRMKPATPPVGDSFKAGGGTRPQTPVKAVSGVSSTGLHGAAPSLWVT